MSASELTLTSRLPEIVQGSRSRLSRERRWGWSGRNGCGKTSLPGTLSGEPTGRFGEKSRAARVARFVPAPEFELDDHRTRSREHPGWRGGSVTWMRRYEERRWQRSGLAELAHAIEEADGWNLNARLEAEASVLAGPAFRRRGWLRSRVGRNGGWPCACPVGRPDLLLLDEPTNHLDVESIRWLEVFLRAFPGAVIFVTHDRYFLDVIATRIVELAEGRGVSHPGITRPTSSRRRFEQRSPINQNGAATLLAGRARLGSGRGPRATCQGQHRLDTFYGRRGSRRPLRNVSWIC